MATLGKRRRSDDSAPSETRKAPRRNATLYDAVAGNVGSQSFLTSLEADPVAGPKLHIRNGKAVYPEEVLFRQQRAPMRYAETDTYFAHERLDPVTQRLPDSDLLVALHRYASEFYAAKGAKLDYRSLDETALLALGILVEEMIAHRIGPTGDLAFVEGEDADQGLAGPGLWDGRERRRSVVRRGQPAARDRHGGQGDLDSESEVETPPSG